MPLGKWATPPTVPELKDPRPSRGESYSGPNLDSCHAGNDTTRPCDHCTADGWPVPTVASLTDREDQVGPQVSYLKTTKAPGSDPLVSHSWTARPLMLWVLLGHSSSQTRVLDPTIHLLLPFMRIVPAIYDACTPFLTYLQTEPLLTCY